MNIVENLQRLDTLIIEHTDPPITSMLRNQVSICLDQAEAHADAVKRQEQTLANQIETINQMGKQKSEVDAQLSALKLKIAQSQNWDRLARASHIEARYRPPE